MPTLISMTLMQGHGGDGRGGNNQRLIISTIKQAISMLGDIILFLMTLTLKTFIWLDQFVFLFPNVKVIIFFFTLQVKSGDILASLTPDANTTVQTSAFGDARF